MKGNGARLILRPAGNRLRVFYARLTVKEIPCSDSFCIAALSTAKKLRRDSLHCLYDTETLRRLPVVFPLQNSKESPVLGQFLHSCVVNSKKTAPGLPLLFSSHTKTLRLSAEGGMKTRARIPGSGEVGFAAFRKTGLLHLRPGTCFFVRQSFFGCGFLRPTRTFQRFHQRGRPTNNVTIDFLPMRSNTRNLYFLTL